MSNLGRLHDFIADFTRLIDRAGNDEETILAEGRHAVAALVAADDWLPESYAQPHPQYYQQYLLHCDPLERFSVVSFVWGPGQATPVHDHTVWGIIGVLRGAELSRRFTHSESGSGPLVEHGRRATGARRRRGGLPDHRRHPRHRQRRSRRRVDQHPRLWRQHRRYPPLGLRSGHRGRQGIHLRLRERGDAEPVARRGSRLRRTSRKGTTE